MLPWKVLKLLVALLVNVFFLIILREMLITECEANVSGISFVVAASFRR